MGIKPAASERTERDRGKGNGVKGTSFCVGFPIELVLQGVVPSYIELAVRILT